MKENKWLLRVGGATIMFTASIFGYKVISKMLTDLNLPKSNEENFNPSLPSPTGYPGEYLQNTMTGAKYKIVDDPENKGRICVRIGRYSDNDKHTLVGAAVAVGPDPGAYIDTNGIIYNSDGVVIGYFDRSALPSYESVPQADENSIVCPE